MFHWWFKGTSMLHRCFKCVKRVLKKCFTGVWGMILLFDTCYLITHNCYPILAIWELLFGTCYLILFIRYLLFVTCCLKIVVWYLQYDTCFKWLTLFLTAYIVPIISRGWGVILTHQLLKLSGGLVLPLYEMLTNINNKGSISYH